MSVFLNKTGLLYWQAYCYLFVAKDTFSQFLGRSLPMKRSLVLFFFIVVACLAYFGNGCKGNSGQGETPVGTLLEYQGCKQWNTGDKLAVTALRQEDCIEYSYDGQKLLLTHINAGFNCCPGTISTEIVVTDRIISIIEREQEAGCLCLCLFDLIIEVENLEPGEYTVRVVEPYIEDGDEPLEFIVQLSSGTSGCYCIERNYYPWMD
jgi:hypothetical protein